MQASLYIDIVILQPRARAQAIRRIERSREKLDMPERQLFKADSMTSAATRAWWYLATGGIASTMKFIDWGRLPPYSNA
jgi:hypothetical protein